MEIVFENKSCLVAVKPVGVLSQKGRAGEPDMVSLLEKQKRGSVGSIYLVHRLDREVGGLMLFAKSHGAASFYASAVENRRVQKEYLAIVRGVPSEMSGEWKDYLYRDEAQRKTVTVAAGHQGAKEARLRYSVSESIEREGERLSLLRIQLLTGRNHQIRVQCASRHLPLLGDTLYGKEKADAVPALFAWRLTFPEENGGKTTVSCRPAGGAWELFSAAIKALKD